MSATDPAPPVVWTPPVDVLDTTRIGAYLRWLARHRGLEPADRASLQAWSVADQEGFWGSLWDHFAVRSSAPPERVLADASMPGARWFPGARLNYAEQALAGRADGPDADRVAVVATSQTREPIELTWAQLADQVARVRGGLARLGVGRGDRVVAYLPNLPETVVAFLATASLGAVWAACAPEFGARSVLDRFGQLEPTVLLAVTGYRYGAKDVDRGDQVAQVARGLPSLRAVVHVPYGYFGLPDALADALADREGPAGGPVLLDWQHLLDAAPSPGWEQVAFDHPLCVLFSSGTTGVPKAIVHGHGLLLEQLKNNALSWDLGPGDRILWFSTTAWMMWNSLVSALLNGASIVLLDGDPVHPDLRWQWRLAQSTGATLMGASPGFLMASRAAGVRPGAEFDLSRLRQLASAGSPLPAEGYRWVARELPGVLLNVGSGGTDVCTGILQGDPWQPVWEGEISGAALGVDARAFDADGTPVVGEPGELVITSPMPSMPVGFWGDDDGSRYRAAYFDTYPGVWRHGDWVRFCATGSAVVTGRSDATLNRGGVRLGTAEFYRVVEELPHVADSLVVHLEDPAGGNGELLLFVVLTSGNGMDDALRREITGALRTALSPRHVPDAVLAVPAVPRGRTGKKLEVPVKRILLGDREQDAVGRDVLADPRVLEPFRALARSRGAAVAATR